MKNLGGNTAGRSKIKQRYHKFFNLLRCRKVQFAFQLHEMWTEECVEQFSYIKNSLVHKTNKITRKPQVVDKIQSYKMLQIIEHDETNLLSLLWTERPAWRQCKGQ